MPETKLQPLPCDTSTALSIDCAVEGVHAGFPSPAEDYTESIDLNKELIAHPATTFYARAIGDSMIDRGIANEDLLIIDKALTPREGNVVVAFIDGEFTLKTLHNDPQNHCCWLLPANKRYKPIKVTQDNELVIWGVVTFNIKNQLRHT